MLLLQLFLKSGALEQVTVKHVNNTDIWYIPHTHNLIGVVPYTWVKVARSIPSRVSVAGKIIQVLHILSQ